PGADESTIDFFEQRLAEVPPFSHLLEYGVTPEQVLYRLLGDDEVEILEKMPVQFTCDCSTEKFATALIADGIDELNAMI
ncbi:Hsp33 family molecular chaperone HslO, partial [Enterococcus faecalis]|uniref:Hsp33 family molecular chaperone HslO n=1 Tax=Enterococcus faecalis TaxID=1351 RepID=UPI003CC69F68